MYLVDEELARGYLKHQARILKEQTILCAARPSEEKGKALGILGGRALLDPVARRLYTMEVMSTANRLFRGCWRKKMG